MTIRELAKLIGVSPATISIVLNGKKGVSEDTRKRVLKAIETYNYIPPAQKIGKSKNVLLVKYCKSGMFVEENQGFISTIIFFIEEQLRAERLGMTMMAAKGDLMIALNSVDYSKYCGMILIATELTEDSYRLLNSIPIPFVIVDNTIPNYHYNSVCMNNYENVRIALKHCCEFGHTKIGYIGSTSNTENFKARSKAFQIFVNELGMQFEEKWSFRITPTMLGAYADFFKILDTNPEFPACFFAENDTIALGAIKALKAKGYKVPNDISVIGFDDIPYASISSPALTTVHVQRDIMGKQSVLQLIQLMADSSFRPIKTRITGHLVIRESVKDLRNNK